MKKRLLFSACLLASAAFANFNAEAATSKFYLYNQPFDWDGDNAYLTGQLTKTSKNGQYAIGFDDSFTGMSYMWDATSKKLNILNLHGEFTGKAYDVTNDGTVVGCFDNGEGKLYPGYYKDGKVTILPLCDNVFEDYLSGDTDYAPTVKAVSSDGKYMAASVSLNDGRYHPIQWIDGKLKEFPGLELFGQGFMVMDMSQDGSIIVGWNENEKGESLPAYIKNGVLKNIIDKEGLFKLFNLDPEDDNFFISCQARSIDAEGNITGYVQNPANTVAYGFIYNETTGFKLFSEAGAIATCSVNSNYVLGSVDAPNGDAAFIYADSVEDAKEKTGYEEDGTMTSVWSVSDNGKLIVGSGILYLPEIEGNFNVPAVIEYPDANPTGSVSKMKVNDTTVTLQSDGVISVDGDFDALQVYSMSGALVASGAKGHVVSIENMPKGIYIVAVSNGLERTSYKVVK